MFKPSEERVDVLVAGGGNAGMCAALSARELGASVLVVERAPQFYRGGNSRHTRDVRCLLPRDESNGANSGYTEDEFYTDLVHVTGDDTNQDLARLAIRESATLPAWMARNGVRWQRPIRGTLQLSRTNVFMLGGGRAMLNGYYETARRRGIRVLYDTEVRDIELAADGRFLGAMLCSQTGSTPVRAGAAVFASGGFEANIEWLSQYWGSAAREFVIRGTPYNDGAILRSLLDQGVQPVGDPKGLHAVAVDGRAPRFDGGIVTRLDSVPFGIAVNRDAQRFYDEGEDFWPKRYAIWGSLIAEQPGQVAYSIVDRSAMAHFLPAVFPAITAPSIEELAELLSLSPGRLRQTIDGFNRACRPGHFDPASLDDCRTSGLSPDKSHWATPLATPPFSAYPLRPGITFTYMGVMVDTHAGVIMSTGGRAPNVFAAGEIMAGNILRRGYLAGFGLTIGAVFGRRAGWEAARSVRG